MNFKSLFLLASALTIVGSNKANAQSDFLDGSEATLNKLIQATTVCAKMTDPTDLYIRGKLLLEDQNEEGYMAAAECFTSAAMRNHTGAQIELGKLYDAGNGVATSKVFAYKWYQTAVLLGNKDAVPLRDALEREMATEELEMAIPMIRETIDLIDRYNSHATAEVNKYEESVDQQYTDFNVDLSKIQRIEAFKKDKEENTLVEALIRDQKARENAQKQLVAERNQQQNAKKGKRRRGAKEKEETEEK